MSLFQDIAQSINPGGIDDLKAVIAKRGGLAHPNRFGMFMTLPSLINTDIQGHLISAATGNFNVKDLFNDPRDVALLCESASLPSKIITSFDYAYKGYKQNIKIPSGCFNEDVTLTFLLTNDYYAKKMFNQWQNGVMTPETYTAAYEEDYKSDVTIFQMDENGAQIYGIKLRNAYPLSVNAITLDNTASSSIQRMSVVLTYEEAVTEGALESMFSSVKTGVFGSAKSTLRKFGFGGSPI